MEFYNFIEPLSFRSIWNGGFKPYNLLSSKIKAIFFFNLFLNGLLSFVAQIKNVGNWPTSNKLETLINWQASLPTFYSSSIIIIVVTLYKVEIFSFNFCNVLFYVCFYFSFFRFIFIVFFLHFFFVGNHKETANRTQ